MTALYGYAIIFNKYNTRRVMRNMRKRNKMTNLLKHTALLLALLMLAVVLASCTLPPISEDDGTSSGASEGGVSAPADDTEGGEPDEGSGAAGTDPAVDPIVTDPIGTVPIATDPVETTPVPTPEEIPGKRVFVSSTGFSEYIIIYPAGTSAAVRYAAQDLASYLNSTFPGAKIKAQVDGGKNRAAEKEILVGKCDRSEIPALAAGKSSYTVKVSGSKLVLCGADDDATLSAIEYFKYFFASKTRAEAPVNFEYTSASSPKVLSQAPEKSYYYENVYTPTLVFDYLCTPGLDRSKSGLFINGVEYSNQAAWVAGSVTLSGRYFKAGSYIVWLVITDTDGDTIVHNSSFSCGDGSVMNLYSGELHSHTSESDGVGTVEQAYVYARDVAKLDFFAVTDHSNSINLNKYKTIHIPTADRLNDPGKYVTLYGYEQTYNFASGYYGHLNVINYGEITVRSQQLDSFYKQMSKQKNVAVMFNHPGYTWGNFMEYSLYDADIDKVLNLSEIKGKSYDGEYALALSNGWHVSPMYNEDNHTANWGAKTEACGFALAPALTRANIMEAFEKNRTYTTDDKTLRVYYQINGEWMGSRLNNPDKLKVKVVLSTQKPAGLGNVYLMGEDNIIVARISLGNSKSYTWEFEIDPLFDYYYIKIEGSIWCLTAPIWVENRDSLSAESLDFSSITDSAGADDYLIWLSVKNNSKQLMTDVTVDYYISAQGGFDLTITKPYVSVNYGSVPAGGSANISGRVPYRPVNPRVTAVVTGYINGIKYCDTTYLMLSNLYITEVVPSASSYEYIEIYNNSDIALRLSSYSIRYYSKAGASAADLTANTWRLNGTIEPFSSMVVWIKTSSNTRTLADFNKNYGTSLVQDKDIIIVSSTIPIPVNNAVQLELMNGSSVVINRVWYNWANQVNFTAGRGVDFKYPTRFTHTSPIAASMADPSPGKTNTTQTPVKITAAQAK